MAFKKTLLMSEKVSDVKIDLLSEAVEVGDTSYVAYEVLILGYNEYYKDFVNEIDAFHFSLKKDAFEYFNKLVAEGKSHEVGN